MRRRLGEDEELVTFARGLLAGVRKNRGEIDAKLDVLADNWHISRMAVTDRNVLRLAAYEMLFTDAPGAVAIDEAVELAKRFGAKQSPQFVNGILDRLWRQGESTGEGKDKPK